MASNSTSSKVVTVDEQAFERTEDTGVDEDGFEVVDDQPELRATVEQETQAKVDSNHPDGIVQDFSHLPLAQEERIRAREAELERISAQAELGTQEGRAKRTRTVVRETRREQWHSTEYEAPQDPREDLSRMELAKVNREADRLARQLNTTHGRPAVSRAIASRLVEGQDLPEAVFATRDALRRHAALCPIEVVPDVRSDEVSIEGRVISLWDADSPKIAQAGLIADDTGKIKFTSFRRSRPSYVKEGERVRMRNLKKNWYQGRCSLAVTYDSMIIFPDRDDRWWL